jgi:hypothetical protein
MRWSTGGSNEFGAAALLLGRLEWTSPYIDPGRQAIAWPDLLEDPWFGVEGDSGTTLVRFAQTLWTGREQKGGGITDVLRRFDQSNLRVALEALELKAMVTVR